MLPDVGVAVFPQAFVVKAVDLGDLTALMVTAENGDAGFVTDFKGHEQRDGFQRVVSAIDIIAHEQIIGFRTRASNAKKFRQIVKLAVNVTADCHRGAYWLNVAFVAKNFLGLFEKKELKTRISNEQKGNQRYAILFYRHRASFPLTSDPKLTRISHQHKSTLLNRKS